MKIAAGILGILGGIFGSIAAFVTLFLGGVGGALNAEGASTVVGLGWGGLLFSIVSIVFGALAFSKLKVAGYGLVISSILGGILGGTLVAICMIFPLVGGILALVESRKEKSSESRVSEKERKHPISERETLHPMTEKETSHSTFCTFCGVPTEAGDSFCIKCGKPLTPMSEKETSDSMIEIEISEQMIKTETSTPMVETEISEPMAETETSKPITETQTSKPTIETETSKPTIQKETLGAREPGQKAVSERETLHGKRLTQSPVAEKRPLRPRGPTQRMTLHAKKTMPTGTKILIAMGGVVIILLIIILGLSTERGKALLSKGANAKLSGKLISSTATDHSAGAGVSTRINPITTIVVEITTPSDDGALIRTEDGEFFLHIEHPRGKEIFELLQESRQRKSPVIITYEEGGLIENVKPAISG